MTDNDDASQEELSLTIKWNGQDYTILCFPDDDVALLKRRLGDATRVLPSRQKIMGLKLANGKPPGDTDKIGDLKLKQGQKIMMLGSQEEAITALDLHADDADVADFEIEDDVLKELAPHEDPDVLAKLERRLKSVDVEILNPPRPGKKLMVTDIDYTIFDLGSAAEQPMELARPHLHKFLESVYENYDIVIWSANSMKWMKVKMEALGVLNNDKFKVTFMLDYRAMLTVHNAKYGVFDCKPLQFLWSKFGEHYNKDNTIMLDDLRRNYIMNKQNGLVIYPFQKAYKNRATDRELVKLKYYFKVIAKRKVLSDLNHKKWKEYIQKKCSPEELQQLKNDVENP